MRRIWRIIRRIARDSVFRLILFIGALIILAAVLVYMAEERVNHAQFRSVGDAIWWAIVTMTTVGYGDKIPITPGGRAVAIFMMFGGVVLISVLTATVSSIFVTRILKETQGLKQVRLRDHIIVCGWNYNTEDIIRTFSKQSPTPMDIALVNEVSPERLESLLHQFANLNIRYVHGDFTKESVLHLANIKWARAVIILPDITAGIGQQTDDKTLLATLTIKSLNPKAKIYAHIVNRSNYTHLKRARADEVIVSDEHIGFFIANHILYPGAPQVVRDLLDYEHGQYIQRVTVPHEFVGKTYGDLLNHFKRQNNWTLIGIGQDVENVQLKDVLTHDYTALDAFIERKFREAGIDIQEGRNVRTVVNPPLDHLIGAEDFAIVIGALEDGGEE